MEIEGCSVCQGPGQVGLFVCILLRIKSLDLHLPGKFVNGLPYKLGKLGKIFYFKTRQWTTVQQKQGGAQGVHAPKSQNGYA